MADAALRKPTLSPLTSALVPTMPSRPSGSNSSAQNRASAVEMSRNVSAPSSRPLWDARTLILCKLLAARKPLQQEFNMFKGRWQRKSLCRFLFDKSLEHKRRHVDSIFTVHDAQGWNRLADACAVCSSFASGTNVSGLQVTSPGSVACHLFDHLCATS